jgi:hypothetical protein
MKLLLAIALPGCAQLFGLDTTTGGADAPSATSAHFAMTIESVGATLVDAPDDPAVTQDTVAFLVPSADGSTYTTVPSTLTAAGNWDGAIPVGNPLIDFTLTGHRHIWAVPSRDVKLTTVVLGHPNPVAPPDSSMFTLSITAPSNVGTAGESLTFMTVGAWSAQGIPEPAMATPTLAATIAYTAPTAIGGPLEKVTPTDAVLVYRNRPQSITSVGAPLDGVFQTSVDQTGTDTLTGTLADTAVDKTVGATITPMALATRYTAVRPAVSSMAIGWLINAAPGYARGVINGPTLNTLGIAISDTQISAAYGNPFSSLNWKETLFYNSYESRTAMVGGAPLALNAGLETIVAPSTTLTLDMPAGLPQSISIADHPLATDNDTITIDRSKYVHFTMVNDRDNSTFLQIALYDLTSDGVTVTQTLVIDALAIDPTQLVLPPDAFVMGHTYVVEALTHQSGWPNAATGDFSTQALPFYIGYAYSGTFTVMN